jgi:hypothetical protein
MMSGFEWVPKGGRMTRVPQPTVERVLRRDYLANFVDEILALIATVEVREKPRVVLACLKIFRMAHARVSIIAECPCPGCRTDRVLLLTNDATPLSGGRRNAPWPGSVGARAPHGSRVSR